MTTGLRWRTVDTETITIDNTSGGVRLSLSKRRARPLADRVVIYVRTAAIMWLSNGTSPTTTVGNFHIPTMSPIVLEHRNDIEEFRAIRQASANASINVNYQRSF